MPESTRARRMNAARNQDGRLSHSSMPYDLYEKGRKAMDAGERVLAIEYFRRSVANEPHFKACELLGECLIHEGLPGEAALYLAAAIGLGWRQTRSRFLLAQALLALDESLAPDAARHLQEAVRMNPNYKAARQLLAELLAKHPSVRAQLEDTLP